MPHATQERAPMKPFAFAIALAALAGPASAASPDAPALVELFTSQGCSSCPPADAYMAELARRDDVVALSFHVDYWDRLGWPDTLGSPANTQRQRDYARQRGDGQVYTPQMVVSGDDHAVGSLKGDVSRLISASDPSVDVDCSARNGRLRIALGQGDGRPGHVWLAVFDVSSAVPIARGENTGRTITYTHSVRKLVSIAQWDGKARTIEAAMPALGKGQGAAVFVEARDGRILGADYAKR